MVMLFIKCVACEEILLTVWCVPQLVCRVSLAWSPFFASRVYKAVFAFAGHGADVILDCVGGSFWEQNVECAAPDARWVLYGTMGELFVRWSAGLEAPNPRKLVCFGSFSIVLA